jgi:hypothetical protein
MVKVCPPEKLVWGLPCTPVFALPSAIVVYVVCIPVGLLAGALINGQPTRGKRYKIVIRDV